VIEALIDAGADVNATPSPLLAARSARAVRLLVRAGANVHARSGTARHKQRAEMARSGPEHAPLFPERQPFEKDFARVITLLDEAIARRRD